MEDQELVQQQQGSLCCRLCGIFCGPPIPSIVTAKLAFFPPHPPSYEFQDRDMIVTDPLGVSEPLTPPGQLHLLTLQTRNRNSLAAFFHELPGATYTLLFSHGNAVDLGQLAPFLISLGQELGCNVFAYDYSGYGRSTGKTREKNMYKDIEAAWRCLRDQFGVPAHHIILYGQSIGTVATVDLAARIGRGRLQGDTHCAGVILHSPLMSGLRVLRPKTSITWCCDPFPSIEKIHHIRQPTLIMHGMQDEVVHVSHGHRLLDRARHAVDPLFIEDAGHNDLESFAEFRVRLLTFLQELQAMPAPQ